MRFSVPTVLVAFVACSIAACGGRAGSAGDDDDTAGNDSGGTSSGGSSAAGKSNGGSKTGGSNAGGTSAGGGSSVCDGFSDDLGYQLPVMIVNETTTTIHVGSDMGNCGYVPLFQVGHSNGSWLPDLGDCRSPCEAVMKNGPLGCPAICRFPDVRTLAPGESVIEVWSGLYGETMVLPPSCVADDLQNEVLQCSIARQIQPGTYRFAARAGTGINCTSTTGGPCGACSPDSRGGCVTAGGLIAGNILNAETIVDLGPSYGVYDSAARPANPDPGSGAGAAPAGMINSVVIVFRD
jgi:hypothetical protein